jgi:hypothetical protein
MTQAAPDFKKREIIVLLLLPSLNPIDTCSTRCQTTHSLLSFSCSELVYSIKKFWLILHQNTISNLDEAKFWSLTKVFIILTVLTCQCRLFNNVHRLHFNACFFLCKILSVYKNSHNNGKLLKLSTSRPHFGPINWYRSLSQHSSWP